MPASKNPASGGEKPWRRKSSVNMAGELTELALARKRKLEFEDSHRINSITHANELLADVGFWKQPPRTRVTMLTHAMNSAATQEVLDYLARMREEAAKNIGGRRR